MSSDQQWGEYRGIKFTHEYDGGADSRSGVIDFPDEPRRHSVTGGGGARWEAEARNLIDRYFREIDVEPDDDSEA
ncbi:hypothetical protein DWU98_06085 [Dyella monticola]|uniref:Uncharacterized protein n=1 Tax=Dyella monticola TaxID=1927958 RepID=A0A370X6B4_9GAMM|nr:hypothetical protein [Dyella monticola]RDS83872.1 hypothetical protein DWU98_06085 [Dyella monticola]